MAKKTLFMESTEISPTKTAHEITTELVRAGATSINSDYKDGKISGLRWILRVNGVDVLFDMPARIAPLDAYFRKRHSGIMHIQDAERIRAKAERVAWRQLLRWVQAQNAMIETGMVQAAEVFSPYMVVGSDAAGSPITLFQRLSESRFKMLGAPAAAS